MVKDVEERYSEAGQTPRIALKPYRSTRMGPPIRHAIQKLNRRPARKPSVPVRRLSKILTTARIGAAEYGIQDTKVALQEARRKGIHTFCITVDREGSLISPRCAAQGSLS